MSKLSGCHFVIIQNVNLTKEGEQGVQSAIGNNFLEAGFAAAINASQPRVCSSTFIIVVQTASGGYA